MKQTIKYVFEQLWHLIVLLIIAVILKCCGAAQDFAGAFFPQYMVFAFYVIGMGILSGFLGNCLPRKWHPDKWPFKACNWEKDGKWYQQKLNINGWKDKVFDLGKASVGTTEKKLGRLSRASDVWLLIQETCVAELTHWALILISPVMLFFLKNFWAVVFLSVYILMNLMDIIIQRSNRPRLVKLHEKMLRRENQKNSNNIAKTEKKTCIARQTLL